MSFVPLPIMPIIQVRIRDYFYCYWVIYFNHVNDLWLAILSSKMHVCRLTFWCYCMWYNQILAAVKMERNGLKPFVFIIFSFLHSIFGVLISYNQWDIKVVSVKSHSVIKVCFFPTLLEQCGSNSDTTKNLCFQSLESCSGNIFSLSSVTCI